MLIAEISNNHFGSIAKARELIKVAAECGAHGVKGQAFLPEDIKNGSMKPQFYEQCAFTFSEYLSLIRYGEEIGVPVFYSIFSKCFNELKKHQTLHKVAGFQHDYSFADNLKTFVSLQEGNLPPLEYAHIMAVGEYFEKPKWGWLESLKEFYGRPIGLSDHSLGIEACLYALQKYHVPVIEKHFSLEEDLYWSGDLYRDSVHGATPFELKQLAKEMRKYESSSLRYL